MPSPLRPLILLASLLVLMRPSVHAQLSIATPGVPVTENFDIPGSSACTGALSWADNSTIANCYSDRPTFYYSTGCANIGGLHVAGLNGETALGGRGSNSTTQVRWGVRFRNNTGIALSALHIRARKEQWAQAQSNLAINTVQFGYRVSASPITDVTSGSYTTNTTWDLVSVTPPGSCGGGNSAIDGNANSAWMEGCLTVDLAPGDEIMLRWFDVNDACNDHMLCVDDLSVTGVAGPAITGPLTGCAGVPVELSATGGPGLQWSNGDTTATVNVVPGTYTVSANTACGTLTASHTITALPLPSALITPGASVSFCTGDSVTLSASGGTHFLWSTGDTTAAITVHLSGTYALTATNECGSDAASVDVAEEFAPTAAILPATATICPDSTVTLSASGGTSYAWSNGDTTATIPATAAGTYTVTVTGTCGSDQASVTLDPGFPPTAVIEPHGPLVLCPNGTLTITASSNGSYAWNTGDTTAAIVIDAAGTYTVTATTGCGSTQASVLVTMSPIDAAFTASAYSGTAPLEVAFTDESIPQHDAVWDLGNGTSTQPSPTTTYADAGVYPVVLTITDASGCTDTAMATIIVLPGDGWITVPNVFSPNGDGANDLFRVRSQAIAVFECTLFNRWGKEVAHLQQVDQGWDGRLNGDPLAEGVYYYLIHAEDHSGHAFDLNGNVTLLR